MRKRLGIIAGIAILLFAFNTNADAALVSWWKMDETSGTNASDAQSGNTGTLNNFSAPGCWTTDTAGGLSTGALNFDADTNTPDYVSVPDSGGSLHTVGAGGFTVDLRVKFDTYDTNRAAGEKFIAKGNTVGESIYFDLTMYWRRTRFTVGDADGNIQDLQGGPYLTDDGLWHHVCARSTFDRAEIFIDGTSYVTNVTSRGSIVNDGNVIMGVAFSNLVSDPFEGMMDDVRIWNHALSDEDILWNANHPGQCIPEPSTLLLLGGGLFGILVFRAKRNH